MRVPRPPAVELFLNHGDSDRVLFWGNPYIGRGDPEVAIEAIETASKAAGLSHQVRRTRSDGVLEIDTVQVASRRQIWSEVLLQRVVWRVEGRDGVLHVTSDARMFPWFARRVLLLALAIGVAFALSAALDVLVFTGRWRYLQALDLLLILPSGLALWLVDRFRPLGGGKVDDLRDEVLARLEQAGGSLEPAGIDASRRYTWSFAAYLGYFFLAVAGWLSAQEMFGLGVGGEWTLGEMVPLAAIVFSGVLLVGLLVAMTRYRGVGERIASVQVGLASSMAMMAFLYGQLLWWMLLRVELPRGVVDTPKYRVLGWFAASIVVLFVGVAGALFRTALSAAGPSREALRRQRSYGWWATSRASSGDPATVRRFRWVVLPVWAVWSCLILAGAGLAIVATGGVLAPGPGWRLDLLESTRFVAAAVLGASTETAWIKGLATLAWVAYAASIVALFVLSVGQLWRARRTARQRLREARPSRDTAAGRCLLEVFEPLAQRAGLRGVRPAVRDAPTIGAWSSSFGFLGQERFVEVTSGALDLLSRDELSALVAHELGHHLRRRPAVDNLVRWLGRVTFTGDGFSRAIQHSFGYEEEADRIAVGLLVECGIDPRGLRTALLQIKHVNSVLWQGSSTVTESGFPIAHVELPQALPRSRGRAKAGFRTESGGPAGGRRVLGEFLEQYTSSMALHYWHPTHDERLANLSRLMASLDVEDRDAPSRVGWEL